MATNSMTRVLGGSPLAVLTRLVLMSILAGVVLSAIGFDPWNLLDSIQLLVQQVYAMGFDAMRWLWRYLLLGAVVVVPIWLIMRLVNATSGR